MAKWRNGAENPRKKGGANRLVRWLGGGGLCVRHTKQVKETPHGPSVSGGKKKKKNVLAIGGIKGGKGKIRGFARLSGGGS